LAIEPPPGSFSWISGQYVRELSPKEGEVTGSNVLVRIGTPVNESLRDYPQIKLSQGDRVSIIERATSGQGKLAQVWYKIHPPQGEKRYVHGQYVRAADGSRSRHASVGAAGRPGPAHADPANDDEDATGQAHAIPARKLDDSRRSTTAEPSSPAELLNRAEAAYRTEMQKELGSRDFSAARRLYRQAAESTGDEQHHWKASKRQEEIEEQEQHQAKLEEFRRLLRRSKQREETLLSMSRKRQEEGKPAAQRFDGSGVLRKSSVQIDGKQSFVLLSPQGGIRYYVTAAPGLDLSEHLDQTVAVRGTTSYRREIRAQHILVQEVMPIEIPREARAKSPRPPSEP
jgi:hypothetical protein